MKGSASSGTLDGGYYLAGASGLHVLRRILMTKTRPFQITVLFALAVALFATGYVVGQSRLAPVQLFGPRVHVPAGAERSIRPLLESWELLSEKYFDQFKMKYVESFHTAESQQSARNARFSKCK